MILRLTCSLVDLYVIQTSHCYMAVAQQGHEKKQTKTITGYENSQKPTKLPNRFFHVPCTGSSCLLTTPVKSRKTLIQLEKAPCKDCMGCIPT